MNQYAGTLIVCVCLAAGAIAVGCDNGGSDSAGGGGASAVAGAGNLPGNVAGAPPAGGGAPPAGAGAPPAGGGAPPAGGGAPPAGGGSVGTEVPLPSDMTGFVSVTQLGIQGAWYAYGDGVGPDGMAATGNCQKVGMHLAAECSSITAPLFGEFPNTDSKMCTSGTVAKVINLTGMTGCPATSASCDYSNIFGAGIGLDVNNAGNDGGMGKLPLNLTAAGIIGLAFDIDMVPLTGLRVEFPTATTADTAAIWKPNKAKNYTSPLAVGHNQILFADVIQPDYVKPMAAKLDPTSLVSIQFHVPTTTSASAAYSFCISNLSAITM
jgi:hypothetical protein